MNPFTIILLSQGSSATALMRSTVSFAFLIGQPDLIELVLTNDEVDSHHF